jgi:hypothetical protein
MRACGGRAAGDTAFGARIPHVGAESIDARAATVKPASTAERADMSASTPPPGADASGPQRRDAPRRAGYTQEGSWGPISDRHWTRARAGQNEEALEYYRERSKAPGVAEGGEVRNFYCMECDGVIPYQSGAVDCPHCGAHVEPGVRRYFNWVEMELPAPSNRRFLLGVALAGLLLLGLVGLGLWIGWR